MDKYDVMGKLGDGTYGIVLRAKLKRTGEVVAIKRMKQRFRTFDECTRLAEVIVLRKLHSCPHVVRLREIFREASGELSLVFDFMDCDLLAVIRKHKQIGIPAARIRNMSFQVIQGLAFIHRIGYFHRDMKPENILVRRDPNGGTESVKLADMGLAKEIRGRPPYTDYVSTRWYRAPEILLQDRAYNSPVDMWAMGCIMVELFTGRPLFPGTNEQDQLFKIVSVLGAPTMSTWPEGVELARKLGRRFPAMSPTPLSQLYPTIPGPALDLIARMLAMNPRQRITAQQALAHPYLQGLADATSGAESTPRPQVMPRPGGVAATAPSPHTKGDPVSWQDVVGSGQKPPSAGGAAGGVPASQRTTAAGSASSGRGVGAAASTVDVLKYSSPYGRGTGAPVASSNRIGRPPAGHAPSGAAMPQSDATPQAPTAEYPTPKPVAGGATGSGRYNFSHQANASTGAKPSWGTSASPAGAATPTSTQQAPQAAAPSSSSSLPQVPKKVEPVVALRDSFDGLFRAAGIDVDAVLARADAPSSSALPKRGSPPASGAPRSPVTVGGTLAMPTRRSPTQIDSTPPPADRSPGAAQAGAAGSSSAASRLVMHGRRQASASPDNENRAPPVGSMGGGAMLGESPLTKLLARSRYRAGASPDAAGSSAAAGGSGAAEGGASGGRQTFKSPSFARRPSPLSVSVLQQKAGGSSSNALGVDSALQAHRRLFDGEPAPGGAASARPVMGVPGHHHQPHANAHHQPLRATHHGHLPPASGGGDHPGF